MLASTAFFLSYVSLRIMFVPPQPPADPVELADQASLDDGGIDPGTPSEGGLAIQDGEDVEKPPVMDAVLPERPTRPSWATLGSMDPNDGFSMLVTLNSEGAGIERIELTERKSDGRLRYRRVDVRSGYFGYLAADPLATDAGVRVNTVGPGTPAAQATCQSDGVSGGLQANDLIVEFDGTPVSQLTDLRTVLATTKPGDQVNVQVLRESIGDQPLKFQTTLTEHPLDLVRLARTGGDDQVRGNLSRLSCLLTLAKVGRKELATDQRSLVPDADPADLIWSAVRDEAVTDDGSESISYSLQLSDADMRSVGGKSVSMQRTYRLPKDSYVLDLAVQLQNDAAEPQTLAMRLEGLNGITLEGWWYSNKISPNWGGSAARDVIYRSAAQGHNLVSGYGLWKRTRNEAETDDQTIFAPDSGAETKALKYIGVDAQYFVAGYLPQVDQDYLNGFGRAAAWLVADASEIERHKERAVNTSFYLDTAEAELPAGAAFQQKLRLFAGPKQPELLSSYGLQDAIYYGWFSWFSGLMGKLLHALSAVGNYAVAIILLTLVVRGLMFPLSRKAAVNAQRMQELAPELKKIADKYKDDMEGRLRAQRELQQRVGFNPMAGCWPMFLQLPIFIGLYRLLSVDIEIRQAAFASWTSWASNLAAPDMFSFWGNWLWGYLSGRGTGWLGPYFNILPIFVMVLFLLQQKLFMPPATDEQTRLQQKMMTYMTLIMGLFFFRVPAGLCIYFITSSLWGIAERMIVKRTLPKTPHFDKSVIEGTVHAATGKTDAASKGSVSKGDETLADKLRNRIKPTEEPPKTLPRDRKRPKTKKK
ncbi:MAG: YidC/Oxa1 family insertase periplasmic-domain containing protein [Planctomycetota bacterium]